MADYISKSKKSSKNVMVHEDSMMNIGPFRGGDEIDEKRFSGVSPISSGTFAKKCVTSRSVELGASPKVDGVRKN